jgi:hypothetical protein
MSITVPPTIESKNVTPHFWVQRYQSESGDPLRANFVFFDFNDICLHVCCLGGKYRFGDLNAYPRHIIGNDIFVNSVNV